MDRIASPQDLTSELRRLLAYAEGEQPSREVLAAKLRELSVKVAADSAPMTITHVKQALKSSKLRGAWTKFLDVQTPFKWKMVPKDIYSPSASKIEVGVSGLQGKFGMFANAIITFPEDWEGDDTRLTIHAEVSAGGSDKVLAKGRPVKVKVSELLNPKPFLQPVVRSLQKHPNDKGA